MYSSRKRATPAPAFTPLSILLLCLFPSIVFAWGFGGSKSAKDVEEDLICHTSDKSECYPRVFKATDEFQVVRDDQQIPQGLHVRLDMTTGKREAKISVDGETPDELAGQPVDQSVLVVDTPESNEAKIPKDAPKYNPDGKIKVPLNEAQGFYDALSVATQGSRKVLGIELDEALELLEDISHDIYYGLKIVEDFGSLQSLFCIMGGRGGPDIKGSKPRSQQAAAVISGALSNNPSALRRVAKSWHDLESSTCEGDSVHLGERFYAPFIPRQADTNNKALADEVKVKVGTVGHLIKDDIIRKDFLAKDGMWELLQVLIPQGDLWADAQRRVGELVQDTFLDESMGATLGQWPAGPRISDKRCRDGEVKEDGGCWDYEVDRIKKANGNYRHHWSSILAKKLAKVREDAKGKIEHTEL